MILVTVKKVREELQEMKVEELEAAQKRVDSSTLLFTLSMILGVGGILYRLIPPSGAEGSMTR